MKVKSFSWTNSYRIGTGDVTHWVELWEQPFMYWLIAKLYHKYDNNIYHVPGVKWLNEVMYKRKMKREGIFAIPWLNNQDIRCDYLRHRGRRSLIMFEVDDQTYEDIKGRIPA